MNQSYIMTVKANIAEQLIKTDWQSKEGVLFEQYKLLVDSAHKAEERRGSSNNIFLGVNSLIASFLVHPATEILHIQAKDIPVSSLFTLVGMFVSWEWVKVNMSFKKLNLINYVMISTFEKLFPSCVFSLRAKIETDSADEKGSNVGNIILAKDNLLPIAFFLLYSIYLTTILFSLLQSFSFK